MSQLKVHKVSTLPATLQANAMYLVKSGTALAIYITDTAGAVAYTMANTTAAPTVTGPVTTYIGKKETYTISNHDISVAYTITAVSGSVVQDGDKIYFTAPSVAGTSGFVVNGKTFGVTVLGSGIVRPILSLPTDLTSISSSIVLSAKQFESVGSTDVHYSTDWNISAVADFSTLAVSSVGDKDNKLAIVLSGLSKNTTYYARVRFNGNALGASAWSEVKSFTTKEDFLPTAEASILGAYDLSSSDNFGSAVSMSDDGRVLVVGAPYKDLSATYTHAGGIYVFRKSDYGDVDVESILNSNVSYANNYHGATVAISGDGKTIAVGAQYLTASASQKYGKVTIYSYNDAWSIESAGLVASDKISGDNFGCALSLSYDGNTLLIGSSLDDGTYTDQGSAYVFTRSGTTWTQAAKVLASDPAASAAFGSSVAINGAGTYFVVGSVAKGAYVFTGSGTTWTQQAKLLPSDTLTNSQYANSVTINYDGSYIGVGAYNQTNGAISTAGAVYTYLRTGTTWAQQGKLFAADGASGDCFGKSIAMNSAGDGIVIGASSKTEGSFGTIGSVYTFARAGTVWSEKNKLVPLVGEAAISFGISVDISADGTQALVGAPYKTSYGVTGAGQAYVFK